MDAHLATAARALAAFDPLEALRFIALRDDPSALALRGVAQAQLGDLALSQRLLARAVRGFSADGAMRARCLAAAAEVALAARNLKDAESKLREAIALLSLHDDRENALYLATQLARCLVLSSNIDAAETTLDALSLQDASQRAVAFAFLVRAEIALRRLQPDRARSALGQAWVAVRASGVRALAVDIQSTARTLESPVARACSQTSVRSVTLDEVAALGRTNTLVVDACRRELRRGEISASLATRPVLLAIAVVLGEAAPDSAARDELIARAFGGMRSSDSLRARLRVEIGRLRTVIAPFAQIDATSGGFRLRSDVPVVVLLPPGDEDGDANARPILALLAQGEPWSTSALAAAIGASQRTVQRALSTLEAEGRVMALGVGRTRRWVLAATGTHGFATTLLLVSSSRPR